MQLRKTIQRPGRYKDTAPARLPDNAPARLPENPKPVHPTVPYDHNRPPACFPHLEWDQFRPDHPVAIAKAEKARKEQEEREKENGESSKVGTSASAGRDTFSETKSQIPERPAFVFRSSRPKPVMNQAEHSMFSGVGRWEYALEASRMLEVSRLDRLSDRQHTKETRL